MTDKEPVKIPTQIKDQDLVQRRRSQIADVAVGLFIEKGFHKTTTRQIAQAAGIAIGSLYEYVACKEDVLYLVCESIHAEVQKGLMDALKRESGGRNALTEIIREYLLVCDRMSDFILLMYQETKSLPPQWQKKVLENELRITELFVDILKKIREHGDLYRLDENSIEMVAHNICVLGHMWIFRRWFFKRHYSIDEFIDLQTKFILGMCG